MVRTRARSRSDWAQLPPDLLSQVFARLSSSSLASACQVCRAWHNQILQDAQHLLLKSDPCKAAVDFFLAKLPSLRSLSLLNTESAFMLHALTQISSITFSGSSHVPDMMPLTVLSGLKRLILGPVSLGRNPCLIKLTQLRELALLGSGETVPPDVLNTLLQQGSLEQLQLAYSYQAFKLELPDQPKTPLQSLLLSAQLGITQQTTAQLSRLKVLALMSIMDPLIPYGGTPVQPVWSALTGLEALSLACKHAPLDFRDLASLTSLRVLDLRRVPMFLSKDQIDAYMAFITTSQTLHLLANSNTTYPGTAAWSVQRMVDVTELAAVAEPLGIAEVPWSFTGRVRNHNLGLVLRNMSVAGRSCIGGATGSSASFLCSAAAPDRLSTEPGHPWRTLGMRLLCLRGRGLGEAGLLQAQLADARQHRPAPSGGAPLAGSYQHPRCTHHALYGYALTCRGTASDSPDASPEDAKLADLQRKVETESWVLLVLVVAGCAIAVVESLPRLLEVPQKH
ncbi:hypothetical protein WJX73_003342 [Symbiochloris irregularis]|uniref:F-box domain-containing protein n=1 Tax=Symbiochloris irregularis TaxID=706552 RepID=A0AAW1P4H3_9CHLO